MYVGGGIISLIKRHIKGFVGLGLETHLGLLLFFFWLNQCMWEGGRRYEIFGQM